MDLSRLAVRFLQHPLGTRWLAERIAPPLVLGPNAVSGYSQRHCFDSQRAYEVLPVIRSTTYLGTSLYPGGSAFV